jgi:virulence-associated protein VagC
MGTLPKPEPQLAEVVEIDGKQMVRLPKGLNLKGKLFHVIESGDSIHLNPPRKVFTPEDWKLWLEDMHRFQEELGDLMPEGRNQPPMPTQA